MLDIVTEEQHPPLRFTSKTDDERIDSWINYDDLAPVFHLTQ